MDGPPPAPDPAWPAAGRPAVVVTGASSGIGRELARIATREGLELLLLGRSAAALEALAAELGTAGRPAHAVPLDLLRADAAVAVGQALAARGLVCDVLVNNAGAGLLGEVATLDPAAQLGIVDLNVRAATALAQAALPGMLVRRRGGILNVASVAGFLPGPGMAVYYASKAYLRSLSEALWAEAAGSDVRVSCLCPGPVETAFFGRAGAGRRKAFDRVPKATAARVAARGWAGFERGRRIIFPDLQSRLTATLLPWLPRGVLLPLVWRFQRKR